MCLVAFQKIFRKIFSGVWKRRRKTQIQKNTSHNLDPVRRPRHRSQSEIAIDGAIAISPSLRDRNWRRDLAKARSQSSWDRDRRRDLAKRQSRSQIFLSRLHTRSCDRCFARLRSTATGMFADEIAIGADWSSEFANDRRTDWNVSSPLARARAFSLSYKISGNTLKGK